MQENTYDCLWVLIISWDYYYYYFIADGVMTVEWSTSSEWVLVTGGCDGAIRFWDIRRAGCFLVLNQSSTQLGRRPSILKRSMITKVLYFFSLVYSLHTNNWCIIHYVFYYSRIINCDLMAEVATNVQYVCFMQIMIP